MKWITGGLIYTIMAMALFVAAWFVVELTKEKKNGKKDSTA